MAIHRPKSVSSSKDLTFVLLCAHPSYRMKSYGNTSMMVVRDGKTLLEHNCSVIKKFFPDAEIIIVTGFESKRFVRNRIEGTRIVEQSTFGFTHCVESARLALQNLNNLGKVVFIYGDTFFTKDIFKGYSEFSHAIVDKKNMEDFEVGVVVTNNNIQNFVHGTKDKWAGIIQFAGKELQKFISFCNNDDNKHKFIFEGLNHIISTGGKFEAVYNNSFVKKITQPNIIQEIKNASIDKY